MRLIGLLTVPLLATLLVALPASSVRKGGVHIEAENGTVPLRFVAILSPGRAGTPDTLRGQTPADVPLHFNAHRLDIRSEDPHRRLWVRGGAITPSLYQLFGVTATRVVLGMGRGGFTLVTAVQSDAPLPPERPAS